MSDDDALLYGAPVHVLGWRVFRVTADMLRDDPHGFVGIVRAAVEGSGR